MKETILQFGAGNFLRAFVDLFVAEANRNHAPVGKIVVVQSTGKERADALNKAHGRYHVAIQGYSNGAVVDEVESVDSISRALFAGSEWPEIIRTVCSDAMAWIVSNTTEAGFALDPADTDPSQIWESAPRSFPAKLLATLLARQNAGLPGLTILPCELIENNGDRLQALVLEQAARWNLPTTTCDWLRHDCRWINNLVDRIVPGTPASHPLLSQDPLLLGAEPFAFWALQNAGDFPLAHPAILCTSDISPYYLRKVRILNGAHTALAAYAMPRGLQTVRECLEHPEVGPWLEDLLFGEIVPVLEGRVADPSGFARTTLDRFRNPFLEHKLSAIALHHETKLAVRLKPTMDEYLQRFQSPPPILSRLLGA